MAKKDYSNWAKPELIKELEKKDKLLKKKYGIVWEDKTEKAEKILLINKLKKHKYNLKLSQVKSNLVLRIPKEVSDVLNLRKGRQVEFSLKDSNEIIIHPLETRII